MTGNEEIELTLAELRTIQYALDVLRTKDDLSDSNEIINAALKIDRLLKKAEGKNEIPPPTISIAERLSDRRKN